MPDVIVTGLPRSGSAVASALIDSIPGAVALNLPPHPINVASKPLEVLPYCKWLYGDFAWTRRQLLEGKAVADYRAADGAPLLDGMFDPLRKTKADAPDEQELVYFTKAKLAPDFILAMRHHTLFTSILPTLVQFGHFKIIAVIRHPLDVILSWRQLNTPVLSRQIQRSLISFWPEALSIIESGAGEPQKMVQLYEAYLGRYHELRQHVTIVRYEDLCEDPAIIHKMLGARSIGSSILERIELNERARISDEVRGYKKALRQYGVYSKIYYPD